MSNERHPSNAIHRHAIDEKWMRRALELAGQGRGRTSPNPMVGAVVVRNGRLISEGWHRGPGEDHAEVDAFRRAESDVKGATLYVTLEPCSHWGRTGPCSQAIIEAGIKRVVAAVQDPNPKVNGRGFEQMRQAGLQVDVGVLQQEAVLLNREFFTAALLGRPYVYAKLAQSLDGRAATRTGVSQWITSEASRSDAHQFRAEVDAILVGVGTVLADNPRLTARPAAGSSRQPLRVILDSTGRTPLQSACLHQPGSTLIALTRSAPPDRIAALQTAGASVWLDESSDGRVNLERLLSQLARRDVRSILVEGGPTVVGSFFDQGLVDEVRAYIAPMLIGGEQALMSVGGVGAGRLEDAPRFVDAAWTKLGDDMKFSARVPREHLDDVFERDEGFQRAKR